MTAYQTEMTAVQAAAAHQSFLSAPSAMWEAPEAEAVLEPSPEDKAEAAALFAAMVREAANAAVGAALAAVAEVFAEGDDPLLGAFFDAWATAALDALDPADRMEGSAA